MAPIRRGYYQYPALLDGTLDISHLFEINEAMAFEDENQARIQAAMHKD